MSMLLRQLGPFHLHEEISSDNGILVYYATDTRTRQNKLVYVLDPSAGLDETDIQRFVETVTVAQQLQHPNIISFDEYGASDGCHFAATQPLLGWPLTHELSQPGVSFSFESVALAVQQVAAALDFAAEQGFLHGALSPAEVWMTADGSIQVSGFGLTGLAGSLVKSPVAAGDGSADGPIAGSGAPDVTPYMAPEQVQQAGAGDRRSDVYSLGAVAYTLLVGRPPFVGDHHTLSERILHRPPPQLEQVRPGLPPLLSTVLHFALAKDPASRYATAGEFARAFAQAQQARSLAAPIVYREPPSVLRTLLALTRPMRTRYGLLIALPLLIIALLAGMLLVSRSFSNALSPQPGPGTGQEIVQNRETPPRGVDRVTPEVAVVETATGVASLAVSLTLPAPEPTSAPTPASQDAATRVDPPGPDPASLAPPAAAPPVEAAVSVTETVIGDGRLVGPTVEPAAGSPAGSTATATVMSVTGVPSPTPAVSAQPLAPILRTITDQIIQSVATLTVATPSQNEAVTTVLTETQPPPAETGVEAEAELQAVPVQDTGLHLPLVLQSIYAEGIVNVTANLRAAPSTSAGIMGIAQPGQRVTLVACSANCGWYQLASGEWIAAFLVNLVADPAQPLPLATPSPPTE